MHHLEFNALVREICKDLIIDGYKKSKLCKVMLGQHNQPMFENFISKEKNFGIGVLSRIMENFDYELIILPVKKSEKNDLKQFIDDKDQQFYNDIKSQIRETVDAYQIHNSTRPGEQINIHVNSILDHILDNTSVELEKKENADE